MHVIAFSQAWRKFTGGVVNASRPGTQAERQALINNVVLVGVYWCKCGGVITNPSYAAADLHIVYCMLS